MGLFLGSSFSPEADWALRSANADVSENFSGYADRGEFMDFLQTQAGVGSGCHFAYTGASASQTYDDPIPGGSKEKIGLSSAHFLSGGQSAYHRLYASEGATENGPVWELQHTPMSKLYIQFAVRFEPEYLLHDPQSGGARKVLFCNDLNFASGQIILNINSEITEAAFPWFTRVVGGGTSRFENLLTGYPGLGGYATYIYYPFYDSDPGGGDATSIAELEAKHGFNYDNQDETSASYANVPKIFPDTWYVFTIYIDQDFSGATSNGMAKYWMSEYGQAPLLLGGAVIDAGLPTFATYASESIRCVLRPEDATVGQSEDGGCYFDEIAVFSSSNVPTHPGGFALPYPGQEIPSGYPYTAQTEEP